MLSFGIILIACGNIKGIICPKYTFYWCLLGGIYYFFIQSYIVETIIWLADNLAFSFVIGFYFGILTIDVVNSMNLVIKIKRFAKESQILVIFEKLKVTIRESQVKGKEKINYLFAFKNNRSLKDILMEYKELIDRK